MNILCFPYAYGGASIYFNFKQELSGEHNVIALEYAGHSSRIMEQPHNSIFEIVDDMYKRIQEYVNDSYCLLGYSMGGLVTYELYQKLAANKKRLPSYIFLIAASEPNYVHKNAEFEKYGLNQCRDELIEKNGTINEIIENDEIIELLMPSVISDSIAMRDYKPTENGYKVECGVTVVRGNLEEDIENCKENWEKYLRRKIEYITVDGEHFFMFDDDGVGIQKIKDIVTMRLKYKRY